MNVRENTGNIEQKTQNEGNTINARENIGNINYPVIRHR